MLFDFSPYFTSNRLYNIKTVNDPDGHMDRTRTARVLFN